MMRITRFCNRRHASPFCASLDDSPPPSAMVVADIPAGITAADVSAISNIILFLCFTFFLINKVFGPRFAPSYIAKDPFLLAFELTCFFPLAYCAVTGTRSWLYDLNEGFETPESRLYKPVPMSSRKMILMNAAFQLWDFLISLGRKELNSIEMLLHHSLAATLCLVGLHIGFGQFYGLFFMGVTEVSSLPLVYVDLGKFYPELLARYPGRDLAAKVIFFLAFIAIRDFMFIKYSIQLWKDSLHVLKAGTAVYPSITYGFLVTNLFFNVLQIYWTKLLLDGLFDLLKKKKDDGDDEKEEKKKEK